MTLFTENYKSAQVGFGYDSVGRLASLTRTTNRDYTTTTNTNFTLDLLDRVTSITHSKVMGEDAEWYLADRLGSGRPIVDASGAVLDDISYDGFGNGQFINEKKPWPLNYNSIGDISDMPRKKCDVLSAYDWQGKKKTGENP